MSTITYQAIVESLSEIKANQLNEDGHTDVPSSIRMCKTIMEDAHDILCALCNTDMDEEIDTWWTNKLAVSASTLNKLRDYYVHEVDHEEQPDEADMEIEEAKEAPLIDPKIARQAKSVGDVRMRGNIYAPAGPSAEGIYTSKGPLSIDPDYVNRVNQANISRNKELGYPSYSKSDLQRVKDFVRPGNPDGLAPRGYTGIIPAIRKGIY